MPRRNRPYRPAKLGMVTNTTVRASRRMRVQDSGTFGAHRRPPTKGISDDVAYATKINRRAARRAEREWLRSLPKGVTI
jgi:hypothetical protein